VDRCFSESARGRNNLYIYLCDACVQDQSSEVDSRHAPDRCRERRRTVDVARQVPADVRHVASAPRRRRVPASLRVVDAQRRPAAAADRGPFGRQRRARRHGAGQHGRRRLLRPQRRLGAHVDDGGRARGRVPVLPGQDVRRRHLLVPDADAIRRAARSAQPQPAAGRVTAAEQR